MKKAEIIELVKQGQKITIFRGVMGLKPSAHISGQTIRVDTALKVISELKLKKQGDRLDLTNDWTLPA